MGNPTYKAPAIEQFLNDMSGKNRVETIKRAECVICDGPATEFKDQKSIQEYNISGMCQACQDSVFSTHEVWVGGRALTMVKNDE